MGLMGSRVEELRRRHRRILGWSFALAALIHLGLFVLAPSYSRLAGERDTSLDTAPAEGARGTVLVNVTFGPPSISLEDGTVRLEPPDRVLEARRVNVARTWLGRECQWVRRDGLGSAEGAVRLQVHATGRVARTTVAESSGDVCKDKVLETIAGSLWYHWLPDAEAPAPVDLVQPIRAESVRE